MFRQLTNIRQIIRFNPVRLTWRPFSDDSSKEERSLAEDLNLTGIHLDEVDSIMTDGALKQIEQVYPNLNLGQSGPSKPLRGHDVMVIQPWVSYANFDLQTDPDLQLDECVSLVNTITDWKVVDKKIVFAQSINRKQILPPRAFEELKDSIHATPGVSAVMFGLEVLSAIQLSTLENNLRLAVYDRFTTVLNIFRQHARTQEAKLQLALAELPYIKSHLREIHESSEYSSSAESIKMLVGGAGESYYHKRLDILKRREVRLRYLLNEVRKQREITKRSRLRQIDIPTVAVVGYTNSGKTTLVKYLTQDERMQPKDSLFATLDVSIHSGHLPSSKKVFYLDTVGFLSRIPLLLVEAFSTTLRDVQESDLILHVLDVSHPDHKLQHATVIRALESLGVSKNLMDTKLTIGNKVDKITPKPETTAFENTAPPSCDLQVSATNGKNMSELVEMIDEQLLSNLRREVLVLRVENGGRKYSWLKKHTTMTGCEADAEDANYLICRCIFGPATLGRWSKRFGTKDIVEREGSSDSIEG